MQSRVGKNKSCTKIYLFALSYLITPPKTKLSCIEIPLQLVCVLYRTYVGVRYWHNNNTWLHWIMLFFQLLLVPACRCPCLVPCWYLHSHFIVYNHNYYNNDNITHFYINSWFTTATLHKKNKKRLQQVDQYIVRKSLFLVLVILM